MAVHSSILAWEIPWTEEPGRLQSTRLQESDMAELAHVCVCAHTHTHTVFCISNDLFVGEFSFKSFSMISPYSNLKLPNC